MKVKKSTHFSFFFSYFLFCCNLEITIKTIKERITSSIVFNLTSLL